MKPSEFKQLIEYQYDAEQYRDQTYTASQMTEYENYWENKYPGDNDDVLTVPTLVSDAQRQKASLVGGEPAVIIEAVNPVDTPRARVLEQQLNHMLVQLKFMDQLADAVQDTITLGTGILIDGFGSQFGTAKETTYEEYDRSGRDKDENLIEYNSNIYDNLPWTMRVHPSDFLVPPGVTRIEDCPGVWIRHVRHIDDVKNDEKLMKKHRTKITPDTMVGATGANPPKSLDQSRTIGQYVLLYNYYDFGKGKRITYNPNYGFPLADEVDEIMLRIERLPGHSIIFNKNSRKFWGTSDFDLMSSISMEINDARTMQMLLRRLQVVKGFYNKEMVEAGDDPGMENDVLKKMMSEKVMALIGVNGNPAEFFQAVSPQQPYDIIPQINLAKDELEQFGLAVGKLQKGQLSGGRHTKYETQAAEAHHERSMAPRSMEIRNVILDVMRNWSELIFDFWIEPRVVQTYDAAGFPVTVQFKGEDLRGNYNFKMSLDSLRTKSQDERIEEANLILAQASKFTQPLVPGQPAPIDPNALIRQYLSRIGSDWDIESILSGGRPPVTQPVPFEQFADQFNRGQPFASQPIANPNLAQTLSFPRQQGDAV